MHFFSLEYHQKLQEQKKKLAKETITSLFQKDSYREKNFHLEQEGVLYDFSKNLLDREVLLLMEAASIQSGLLENIADLSKGKTWNSTEQRNVLHVRLRNLHQNKKELEKINQFVDKLYQKKHLGSTGKPIQTIINLGIGGSHLGVQMASVALDAFKQKDSGEIFFASHYSGKDLWEILQKCNPENSMLFVCSKSFRTPETLENAKIAKDWFVTHLADKFCFQKHFVAVTSQIARAKDFGVAEQNIFPIDEGIGGRFSISSNMGLSLACLIGMENFHQFLEGFRLADKNLSLPFKENIPVIMAWIGIWYRNFLQMPYYANLPYAAELEYFPSYLQQLEMESNGKTFNSQGKKINYHTSPIVFGQRCTDAQHSFFQLLHQGSIQIPCDFIGFVKTTSSMKNSELYHKKLMSNFFAQQQTLAFGRKDPTIQNFQNLEGNKPSSSLLFDKLSPKRLGQLIAIYEHKVAIQGMLWDICPFDQWGVEYGKKVAENMLPLLMDNQKQETDGLIEQLRFFRLWQ